jgi:hypothetical protein
MDCMWSEREGGKPGGLVGQGGFQRRGWVFTYGADALERQEEKNKPSLGTGNTSMGWVGTWQMPMAVDE